MRVRLFISKEVALKAGKDTHGYIVVEVPAESLTAEQRDTLATFWDTRHEPQQADFYIDLKKPVGVAEATRETVVEILNTIAAKKAADEVKQKADAEAGIQKWLAEPLKGFLNQYPVWAIRERTSNPEHYYYRIPTDPRLDAACVQAELLAFRLNAEKKEKDDKEKAERDAAEAERKAMRELDVAVLSEWVDANGSALVNARRQDGFEWIGLAEKEFAASVVGKMGLSVDEQVEVGDSWECDETLDRTTPTIEEIGFLRELKIRAADLPVTVALQWMKYVPAKDDYGCRYDVNTFAQTEVEIVVTTPTGREVTYWFPGMANATAVEAE